MRLHEGAHEAAGHTYALGGTVGETIQAYLAALPPSIVVDGKVVELEKAFAFIASEGMNGRHERHDHEVADLRRS